jgi:hypothetical protein
MTKFLAFVLATGLLVSTAASASADAATGHASGKRVQKPIR